MLRIRCPVNKLSCNNVGVMLSVAVLLCHAEHPYSKGSDLTVVQAQYACDGLEAARLRNICKCAAGQQAHL